MFWLKRNEIIVALLLCGIYSLAEKIGVFFYFRKNYYDFLNHIYITPIEPIEYIYILLRFKLHA